mmetsp:Transcript_30582/g.66977  ORF Transcript_30582/g.66977 Transcript_30582/m.66977 type:complete len:81 (-) Transcript_30582:46-288(-)
MKLSLPFLVVTELPRPAKESESACVFPHDEDEDEHFAEVASSVPRGPDIIGIPRTQYPSNDMPCAWSRDGNKFGLGLLRL